MSVSGSGSGTGPAHLNVCFDSSPSIQRSTAGLLYGSVPAGSGGGGGGARPDGPGEPVNAASGRWRVREGPFFWTATPLLTRALGVRVL